MSETKKRAREEQDESFNYDGIVMVEELQSYGFSASDITKLQTAGHYTVSSVAQSTRRELCDIRGFTEAKVDNLLNRCYSLCNMGFTTGKEMESTREKIVHISTGAKELDTLLEGGIESRSVTELFGEYGAGKTQMCHQLAVTCQLPLEQGGAEGKAIYLDTEGNFRPERIAKIANRYGLDKDDVLNNIIHARAFNSDHLCTLAKQLAEKCTETKYSLLIVDSAMGLFRVDYQGRGDLNARQIHLASFLRTLLRLADQFGLAIVITNQVVSDPGAMNPYGPTVKPVGGNIMAHSSTTRLFLRRGSGNNRTCEVKDSPTIGNAKVGYSIRAEGICDVE